MRSFILTGLFISILVNAGHAQSLTDSAISNDGNAAFRLANEKPDSAFAISQHALQQYKKSGNKRIAAFAYKSRGWSYLHLGNFDSCYADLLQSTEFFRQIHDTVQLMYMYVNLANAYSNGSQFASSAKYLMKADSLSQKMDDLHAQAAIKLQMGILYREQKEYQKAIGYFKESIDDYKSLKDTGKYSGAIGSLCILYMTLSMPDSSLALLNEARPLLIKVEGHNYEKAMLNENLGNAYYELSRYEEALDHYNKARQTFAGIDDKSDEAYEAINVGKTHIKLGNYKQAEIYLLQSYHITDSLNMPSYKHDAAVSLSDLFTVTNNWHKAYQWLDSSEKLENQISSIQQKEITAELQAKYEAAKKDNEIILLKKDQELKTADLQKQRTIKTGSFILIGLLVMIGILFINRNRVIQKAKRMVEIEKLRNNIARDLHDDIGSALSSININSKMALSYATEEKLVKGQLEKIKEHSGKMMEGMNDIVWAINPVNDSLEKIIIRMKEFAVEILEPLNINFVFNNGIDVSQIILDVTRRKEIYMIFKEAINNAAKYSGCQNIIIDLERNKNHIRLSISDDGKGFEKTLIKSGNGLRNMEQRASAMGADFDIVSGPAKGTTVGLNIPIA